MRFNITIPAYIKNNISKHQFSLFRKYERQITNYKKTNCHCYFFRRCIQNNVIPKTIKINNFSNSCRGKNKGKEFSMWFLRDRYKQMIKKKQYILSKQIEIKNLLNVQLGWNQYIYNTLLHIANSNAKDIANKIKQTQIKKYDKLHQQQYPQNKQKYSYRRVYNFSSKPLSKPHLEILEKGLNFAIKTEKIDALDIKAQMISTVKYIEHKNSDKNNTEAPIIKSKLFSALNKLQNTHIQTNITPSQNRAMVQLTRDKTRLTRKADKGNAVVNMDISEYETQVKKLLSKKKVYKPQKNNPTMSFENKIIEKLLNLKNTNKIRDNLYKKLRPSGSRSPLFYGQPKIHKLKTRKTFEEIISNPNNTST